jgi:hypothetical protein
MQLDPLTFYPGVLGLESAETMTLRAGQSEGMNVTMHRSQKRALLGVLTERPSSATITVLAHAGGFTLPVPAEVSYAPLTGSFSILGLTDGSYEVFAEWIADNREHHVKTDVVVSASMKPLLHLEGDGTAELHGAVHFEHDGSAAGKTFIQLYDQDDMVPSREVESSVDGRFNTVSVPSGRYHVFAKGACVSSSSVGGREVPNSIIIVASGVLNLDLGIAPALASIGGKIEDLDFRTASSGVLLAGADGAIRVTEIDDHGQFVFGSVCPGDYKLYALADLKGTAYRETKGLSGLHGAAFEFTVDKAAREIRIPIAALAVQR